MIRVCRFVILATSCFVSACGNEPTDPSNAPSNAASPRTVKLGMRSLSASATLTPVNSNQTETDDLGAFQYSTLAVITVAGTETITYANLPGWGSLAGTTMGTFDAGGVFDGWSGSGDCSANVRYGFTQSGGRNICWYDSQQRPPPQSYMDTMVVRGNGTATWLGGPRGWWGFCAGAMPPCFNVSGSFTVDVVGFDATLTLTSSANVVVPGTGVVLTAGVLPVSVGQHSMPWQALQWTWAPDSGSTGGPLCGTQTTCGFTPVVSGVMTLQGVANGVVQVATERIRVNLCPPANDSTGKLDDPDFRKLLLDELAAGRTPPGGPFVERIGYTFRMPDGSLKYVYSGANADDCNVDRVGPTPPPGSTINDIDDIIHVHAVGVNERWRTCTRVQPGTRKTQEFGPSAPDRTALTELLAFNPAASLWLITRDGTVFQVDANGVLRKWTMGSNGCIAARLL